MNMKKNTNEEEYYQALFRNNNEHKPDKQDH